MIKKSDTKNKLVLTTLSAILLLSAMTITINFNGLQNAAAQNTSINTVGTFSAKGYTGQTIILPALMLTPNQQMPLVGSVVGGNWSFSVSNGKLQDFKWNAQAIH